MAWRKTSFLKVTSGSANTNLHREEILSVGDFEEPVIRLVSDGRAPGAHAAITSA